MCVLFLRLRQACNHPLLGYNFKYENELKETEKYYIIEKDDVDFLINSMKKATLEEYKMCKCGFELLETIECELCFHKEPKKFDKHILESTLSTKTLKVHYLFYFIT